MTKKNYVAIAAAICEQVKTYCDDKTAITVLKSLAQGLSDYFKNDNSQYNEGKFLKATNLTEAELAELVKAKEAEAEAIVAAVQNAPTEIREAFETEINVFDGQFDTYVPLGSTIDVGTRRTVTAGTVTMGVVAITPTRRKP